MYSNLSCGIMKYLPDTNSITCCQYCFSIKRPRVYAFHSLGANIKWIYAIIRLILSVFVSGCDVAHLLNFTFLPLPRELRKSQIRNILIANLTSGNIEDSVI